MFPTPKHNIMSQQTHETQTAVHAYDSCPPYLSRPRRSCHVTSQPPPFTHCTATSNTPPSLPIRSPTRPQEFTGHSHPQHTTNGDGKFSADTHPRPHSSRLGPDVLWRSSIDSAGWCSENQTGTRFGGARLPCAEAPPPAHGHSLGSSPSSPVHVAGRAVRRRDGREVAIWRCLLMQCCAGGKLGTVYDGCGKDLASLGIHSVTVAMSPHWSVIRYAVAREGAETREARLISWP
jgi:hypothetical protein